MWFPLSLIAALLVGCSDALAKKTLEKTRSQTMAWVRPGWALFFLVPFLFWAKPPASPWEFWQPVLYAIPLEIIASLVFHHALQTSPLSTTAPYMAFTPVFVLLTGWIFLGESLPIQGMIGIVCVTVGALALQPPTLSKMGKGSLLTLLVAFIYSFTAVLAKKAMLASSPLYFCTVYYGMLAIGLLPFQRGSKSWARELFAHPKAFALLGLLEALGLVIQFTAFQSGNTAYVIAIKRLGLLFSVFFGWLIFQEKNFLSRILAAGLMTVGAVLIVLA